MPPALQSTAARARRWSAVLLVVALGAVLVASCGDDESSTAADGSGSTATTVAGGGWAGVVREPAPDVSTATLPEVVDVATGETEEFSFVAPGEGDVLLVYFGYTHCPDVCPTTLADVRSALDALGPDAERVSVAMATVDPERDTPDVMDGYLRFFVPERSHVLRTEDPDELAQAEEVFGASSRLVPHEDDDEYDVEHTGTLYAVDHDGRLVLEWPFGSVGFEDITTDLQHLLEEV